MPQIEQTNDRIAVNRSAILADAETEILEKLCGVMQNLQTLLGTKLQTMRVQSGNDPNRDSHRSEHLPEKDAALALVHWLHNGIGEYPSCWDDLAIERRLKQSQYAHGEEQLVADLRRRVRSVVAYSWRV